MVSLLLFVFCLQEQHVPRQEVLIGSTWPVSEVVQLSIQDVRLGFREAKAICKKPHTAGPVLEIATLI